MKTWKTAKDVKPERARFFVNVKTWVWVIPKLSKSRWFAKVVTDREDYLRQNVKRKNTSLRSSKDCRLAKHKLLTWQTKEAIWQDLCLIYIQLEKWKKWRQNRGLPKSWLDEKITWKQFGWIWPLGKRKISNLNVLEAKRLSKRGKYSVKITIQMDSIAWRERKFRENNNSDGFDFTAWREKKIMILWL